VSHSLSPFVLFVVHGLRRLGINAAKGPTKARLLVPSVPVMKTSAVWSNVSSPERRTEPNTGAAEIALDDERGSLGLAGEGQPLTLSKSAGLPAGLGLRDGKSSAGLVSQVRMHADPLDMDWGNVAKGSGHSVLAATLLRRQLV
jgi:hypothetical protein